MTTHAVALTDEVLSAWQSLVDTLAQSLNVPTALIMRLTGDEIEVFISSQTEGNPYEPGDRELFFDSGLYCETVIRSGKPLMVPDSLADPDWRENPDVKLGMISYLGMPLLYPDGSPFGTICVLDSEANSYSDLYVQLLQQFKGMAENHLDLAVLNDRLGVRNEELRKALAEVKDLREFLPVCMRCKSVRDDEGYWSRLEAYLARYQNVTVTHGVCEDCAAEMEKEFEGGSGTAP